MSSSPASRSLSLQTKLLGALTLGAVPIAARARQAVLGPKDGKAFMILDLGDRGDIFAMAADGTGAPVAITKGYDAHIWSFAVAPDGKTLVVWDKLARLQKVDVATGRVTLLAKNATGDDAPFRDLAFSPDGKMIAYAETSSANGANTSDLYVQNLATGERVKATSGKYNDYAPAFAHDGAWLYFLSDRNFDPTPGSPWGDRNMGVAFPDRGEIYALQLDPKAKFRFREDNELTMSDEDREKRSPRWIAPIVTWLASDEAAEVTGRIFEASGDVLAVSEGWVRGPKHAPVDDPTVLGPIVAELLAKARKNSGMDGTPGGWPQPRSK